MPRLWMRKLTSIGAVPEGDNPEAQIVMYKRKGDRVDDSELVKEAEAVEEPVEEEAAVEAVVEEDGIAKRIADAESEIAKARDERDAALQSLHDEVQKRRRADFMMKAEALEPLLGPADETAPTLDALEAAAPEAFVELGKRLDAALERVRLTEELGTGGDDGADPISRRDAWVRKYTLDHPDVTEIQARARFWKANPEALEAQREES